MDHDVRSFIGAWFSAETGGDPEKMRVVFQEAEPEFRERLRLGMARILADRDVTIDDVWDPTWLVESDEEFYQQLQKAYDFLFESGTG